MVKQKTKKTWLKVNLIARWVWFVFLLALIWAIGVVFELYSPELAQKLIWNQVQYLGIALLPQTWLGYILIITNRQSWLTLKRAVLLCVVPAAMLGTVLTNSQHGWVWRNIEAPDMQPGLMEYSRGPAFYLFIGYALILLSASAWLLFQYQRQADTTQRTTARSLILVSTLPMAGIFLDAIGLQGMDIFTLLLALLAPVLARLYSRLAHGKALTISKAGLVDHLPDPVIVMDREFTIVDMNQSAEKLLGRKNLQVRRLPLAACWPELAMWLKEEIYQGEIRLRDEHASDRVFEVNCSFPRDAFGWVIATLVALHDITDKKQVEENLRIQAEDQRRFMEAMNTITATLDYQEVLNGLADQLRQAAGAASAVVMEFKPHQASGQLVILAGSDPQGVRPPEPALLGGDLSSDEWELLTGRNWVCRTEPAGQGSQPVVYIPVGFRRINYLVELLGTPGSERIPLRVVELSRQIAQQGVFVLENARLYAQAQRELQERQRVEFQLQHAAFHDTLTGLPNRAYLLDRLRNVLAAANKKEIFDYALLFMDLDRFKDINDTMGHEYGDRFLAKIGDRLAASVRPGDLVTRLGGDEFVVLLENIGDFQGVTRAADRILSTLAVPMQVNGGIVSTSASIGIVFGGREYQTSEDVLRDADIAMYRAKELGGGRFELFYPVLRERFLAQVSLEAELRIALKQEHLLLLYQPIVRLADRCPVGVEVLVRWRHPEKGLLLPATFLPAQRGSQVGVELGAWIIASAVAQARPWQDFPWPEDGFHLFVNLSAAEFQNEELVRLCGATLEKFGLFPSSLCLDVSEKTLVEQKETARKAILQLKAAGLRVYVDHFGASYLPTGALSELPVDGIKIDQNHIRRLSSENNQETLAALIHLGKKRGLDVIAIGVETALQAELLARLGCTYAMGNFFAPAMEAGEVREFLEEQVGNQQRIGNKEEPV